MRWLHEQLCHTHRPAYTVGFDLCRICGGVIMSPIKSVRVLTSQIDDGKDTHAGLAVIIDPMPTGKTEIIQIGDDIKAAVMAFNRKAGDIILNVELNHLIELHEILCEIPFEKTSVSDSEPSTERHPAIESLIIQLEKRMEFFERRE